MDNYELQLSPTQVDLFAACSNGDLELVKLLVIEEHNPIISNVTRTHEDMPSVTRTHISAIDNRGFTLLHIACTNGSKISQQLDKYIEIIKFLIGVGSDISAKDNEGYTPLHIACLHNCIEIVKLLLNEGAQISDKTNYGSTSLNLSCIKSGKNENSHKRQLEVVKLLLDECSEGVMPRVTNKHVSVVNNNGLTPFHRACFNNNIKLAKLLIESGADISAIDNDEQTPLHLACMSDSMEMVKYLIEEGANVLAIDNCGDTPADLLKSDNKNYIEEYIPTINTHIKPARH